MSSWPQGKPRFRNEPPLLQDEPPRLRLSHHGPRLRPHWLRGEPPPLRVVPAVNQLSALIFACLFFEQNKCRSSLIRIEHYVKCFDRV